MDLSSVGLLVIGGLIIVAFVIGTLGILAYGFLFFFSNRLREKHWQNRRRILESLNPGEAPLDRFMVGYFHPYANAGAGGERVLWAAVRDIQRRYPEVIHVVYTGDQGIIKDEVLKKVQARFNIVLEPSSIAFVHLQKRYLVEESRYPRFTLIGQSLGSIFVGYEALSNVVPNLFFDTMGYAFTYPLVYLLCGCKIAAYVHYPTISSDMLAKVQDGTPRFTTDTTERRSWLWRFAKLGYYHIFAAIYGYCGRFADVVMANSTWTKGHVDQIWGTEATIVYPSCDTDHLNTLPLKARENYILSVAQFRPEKDHSLQLRSLHKLFQDHPSLAKGPNAVRLVMLGSSRNQGDEDRIARLRNESQELGLTDNVIFAINAPFADLVSWLGRAKIGLHTMWNEHFGIGVVEYMAAAMIPVAHNSGGPKLDIVTEYNHQKTGFLAEDPQSFADAIYKVLTMPDDEYLAIANNARAAASDKFSEVEFCDGLLACLGRILTS
ncbi:hypothetical protein BZG36_04609 [Bifiguratus adelaidae]|uniref:GDP-Man:Man(3)GlcNAc(2)-PP-Dol alpha-1,2-mannosyltransferase n=1 Tax=Bifiguratus adelaidae TaxID=1938954 RepID=A0A261XXK1_9FUNG|nr:hypothetical protein BZG36_04609 [Bifiguratus adelaidae]